MKGYFPVFLLAKCLLVFLMSAFVMSVQLRLVDYISS